MPNIQELVQRVKQLIQITKEKELLISWTNWDKTNKKEPY